jgi:hypothetical protein
MGAEVALLHFDICLMRANAMDMATPPAAVVSEAVSMHLILLGKMVAGRGFEPLTFRL